MYVCKMTDMVKNMIYMRDLNDQCDDERDLNGPTMRNSPPNL